MKVEHEEAGGDHTAIDTVTEESLTLLGATLSQVDRQTAMAHAKIDVCCP